ncbi:DUF2628 domain-containing protein [Neobacillus notoginsengisoli]|uniref:DUF2628 domain-containing protein n=1 Tax=Neobacillus notoginsengisoli TaxID=1578198 RepID=A0A417YY52_9BACI|nr:DUF2628 domain-containing protein [Neobacillus notoginsengisoli]RHW42712.1 DUF2628 domain-containing protein [Neobacillus notoginsengisoli]
MYCVRCGNQAGREDKFCQACGHQLNKDTASEGEPLSEQEMEEAFVGGEYGYYREKWEMRGNSFNWAAFLVGPFWFGYRKMYLVVLLYSVFLLFWDFLFENESEPASFFLQIPLYILMGFMANRIYRWHARKKIQKVVLLPLSNEQKRIWLKQKGGTSWLGVLAAAGILFSFGILSYILMTAGVDKILVVKDGFFYDYPTMTVGEGLENFFSEADWMFVEDNSPNDVIRFKGLGEYNSEEVDVVIDFILTDESFEIHLAKVDGKNLSDSEIDELLDDVFTTNGF